MARTTGAYTHHQGRSVCDGAVTMRCMAIDIERDFVEVGRPGDPGDNPFHQAMRALMAQSQGDRSLAQVACDADIALATLMRIMNGKTVPQWSNCEALILALNGDGIDCDDILELWKEEKNRRALERARAEAANG